MIGGASFTVTKDTGTVSLCYEHRDPIERLNDDSLNESVPESDSEYDVGDESDTAAELSDEQDPIGGAAAESVDANGEDMLSVINANEPNDATEGGTEHLLQLEIVPVEDQKIKEEDPLVSAQLNHSIESNEADMLSAVNANEPNDATEGEAKVKDESSMEAVAAVADAAENILQQEIVKDENIKEEDPIVFAQINNSIDSNASDCVITAEYTVEFEWSTVDRLILLLNN